MSPAVVEVCDEWATADKRFVARRFSRRQGKR
jgi:hypothetical protein